MFRSTRLSFFRPVREEPLHRVGRGVRPGERFHPPSKIAPQTRVAQEAQGGRGGLRGAVRPKGGAPRRQEAGVRLLLAGDRVDEDSRKAAGEGFRNREPSGLRHEDVG